MAVADSYFAGNGRQAWKSPIDSSGTGVKYGSAIRFVGQRTTASRPPFG